MSASFRYDEKAKLWEVELPGMHTGAIPRVLVDTPCTGKDGVFHFEESIATVGADQITLGRDTPLPHGYINDPVMMDWEVRWVPDRKHWAVWFGNEAVASTEVLTLNCHASTHEGILHCRAECLVNGATFKTGMQPNAGKIHLRTLVVYNQTVDVQVIGMGSKALAG